MWLPSNNLAMTQSLIGQLIRYQWTQDSTVRVHINLDGAVFVSDVSRSEIGETLLREISSGEARDLPGIEVVVYLLSGELVYLESAAVSVDSDENVDLEEIVSGVDTAVPTVVREPATLVRVIDGDTIEVENEDGSKETVRLVGIDAPGMNWGSDAPEMGAEEAAAYLRSLIGESGTTIFIERMTDEESEKGYRQDNYGRTLGVVWHNGTNINRQMVRSEHAKPSYIPGQERFNEHDLTTWTLNPIPGLSEDSSYRIDFFDEAEAGEGLRWDHHEGLDNRLEIRGGDRSSYEESPGELWIGDCRFRVPPLSIQIQQTNTSQRLTPLRSRGSLQSSTGRTMKRIRIELYFDGLEDLNGRKIKSEVLNGRSIPLPYAYHIDGLRPLVAQFMTFPFLPIENRFITDVMGIDAVALQNLVARTVPGFPGVVQVTLELTQFDMSSYIYEEDDLAQLIHWPLFRWHVQQKMLPPEHKDRRGATTLHPIPARGLTDSFLFGYIPSQLAQDHGLANVDLEGGFVEDPLSEIRKAQNILSGIDGVAHNEWEPRTDAQKRFANAQVIEHALDDYRRMSAGEVGYFENLKYLTKHFAKVVDGVVDPEYNHPHFTLPLYDIEELGYDDEIIQKFEVINQPWRGFRLKAGMKLYAVSWKEVHLLERIHASWESYYSHLVSEGTMTEADLQTVAYPIPGLHLVGLEFNLDNILATIQMDAHEVPTHQFLGAMDTYVRMSFETDSEAAIASLQRLLEYSRDLAREAADGVMAGFLTFRNDLTRLFGIEALLIEDIDVSTIAGQPGAYRVEVLAFDFRRTQRDIEAMKFLHGAPEDESGKTSPEMLEDVRTPGNLSWDILQRKISELEAYPDLELPTYDDLARFFRRTGFQAKFNRRRGKYVDPDFFIHPTARLNEMLATALEKPEAMKLKADPAYEIVEVENENGEIEEREVLAEEDWEADVIPGRWIGPEARVADGLPIRDPIGDHQPFSPDTQSAAELPEGVNANLYSYVWIQEKTLIRVTLIEPSTGRRLQADLPVSAIDDELRSTVMVHDYQWNLRIPVVAELVGSEVTRLFPRRPEKEVKTLQNSEFTPQPDAPDVAFFEGHFDMMFKHDKRGRLVRAFPAVGFFLVDEGQQIGIRRLFDSLYGLGSLLSIDITRSRENAVDLAVITFSDLYRQFRSRRGESVVDPTRAPHEERAPLIFNIDQRMIDSRKSGVSAFEIKTGARVHLRLGYGSDISQYPITFNGTVAEMQVGEITTIACQGDGAQLISTPNQSGLSYGVFAEEPRSGIMSLIMAQGSWLQEKIRNWSGGRYFNSNPNGITHFGRVALDDPIGWGSIFGVAAGSATGAATGSLFGGLGARLLGLFAGGAAAIGATAAVSAIGSIRDWIRDLRRDRPWVEGEMGDNVYSANGHGVFKNLPEDAFGLQWWFRFVASPVETLREYNELLVAVQTEGMSIWDIIQTYAMCTPDYVASVEPFGLRSTLFFGKPYFGLAYEYKPGFQPLKGHDPGEREDFRRANLVRRPYSQFYYFDSITDIIRNELTVSRENVYTNVHAVHHDLDGQSTITVSADPNIRPEDQRTTTVYTPIVSKAVGGSTIKNMANRLFELIGIGNMSIAGVINSFWGKQAPNNFAISVLEDFLRSMYQGRLMVLGMPGIKPGDLVHLNDTYEEMIGPFQVREVTTTFSVETGMITSVVPDACVFQDDPYIPSFALWGSTIATGLAAQASLYTMYRSGVLHRFAQYAMAKLPTDVAIDFFRYIQEGTLAQNYHLLRQRAGAVLDDVIGSTRRVVASAGRRFHRIERAIATGRRVAQFARGTSEAAAALVARATRSVMAKALIKTGLRVIGVGLIGEGLILVAQSGLSNLRRKLMNRMPVTMILMTWRGREFSAGISGHKGLVYGDSLGTMERWIEKLTFGLVKYGMGRE